MTEAVAATVAREDTSRSRVSCDSRPSAGPVSLGSSSVSARRKPSRARSRAPSVTAWMPHP